MHIYSHHTAIDWVTHAWIFVEIRTNNQQIILPLNDSNLAVNVQTANKYLMEEDYSAVNFNFISSSVCITVKETDAMRLADAWLARGLRLSAIFIFYCRMKWNRIPFTRAAKRLCSYSLCEEKMWRLRFDFKGCCCTKGERLDDKCQAFRRRLINFSILKWGGDRTGNRLMGISLAHSSETIASIEYWCLKIPHSLKLKTNLGINCITTYKRKLHFLFWMKTVGDL